MHSISIHVCSMFASGDDKYIEACSSLELLNEIARRCACIIYVYADTAFVIELIRSAEWTLQSKSNAIERKSTQDTVECLPFWGGVLRLSVSPAGSLLPRPRFPHGLHISQLRETA